MPDTVGVTSDGGLAPCPDTPNCVNTGLRHPPGTLPILLDADRAQADLMPALRAVVTAIPRTTVVTATDRYLHAEVRSRVFRFVDDVELLVTPDRELIVRSASRVGRSDLGVNAERVRALRGALDEAGLLR